MHLGHGKSSPINFLERVLMHPSPPLGTICFEMLPASSSPFQPRRYLYQILVETWKGKNISSSESFNLSLRVLLGFLKHGGPESMFPISSLCVPCAGFYTKEALTLASLGGEGLEAGVRLVRREEAIPPWAAHRPPSFNTFNLEEALLQPRLDYEVGEGGLINGKWRHVGLS